MTHAGRMARCQTWLLNFRPVPKKAAQLGMTGLCRWALPYALHRWLPLLAVSATMLMKIGLDVLKPWPMKFLVDHVLSARPMPAWMARLVEMLPAAQTQSQL